MNQSEAQTESIKLSLVESGKLDQSEWNRAVRLWGQQEKDVSLSRFLVRVGTVSELDMSAALSEFHRVPFTRLGDGVEPDGAVNDIISPNFLSTLSHGG